MSAYQLDFARVGTLPRATGVIRSEADDFVVDEELGFDPSGEGEHVFLQIRKRYLNTDQVAKLIQRVSGAPRRAISWSGLKDRNACTSQWFGVHLPGRGMESAEDWRELEGEQLNLLTVQRHHRKLRVGTHRANRFSICVRDLDAPDLLDALVQQVQQSGVPNYFGEQRFGRNGANLERAPSVLSRPRPKRRDFQRGMLLSAIRSWVFNVCLDARVRDASWDHCLPGDALQFDGSGSFFVAEEATADHSDRLMQQEVHVTGPLWGAGDPPVLGEALERERKLRLAAEEFCQLMEQAGLRQERRALRLIPRDLECVRAGADQVRISFCLPRGAYATSVLRELVDYREAA